MNPVSFPALKATHRLPSPPAVAIRILQLVADEDTTLDELTQVISADPALTAKILKYLRSPLIGLGFHGTTLAEAVARIGTRGAQLLALSFSLVSQKHHESCPSFNFNRFWSASLARAVAAKRLASVSRAWNPEEAFIAGLLFRIGQLALATALPGEYEVVLRSAAGADDTLAEHEYHVLGTTHLDLSSRLLQDWKLPETVWGVVGPLAVHPPAPDADRSRPPGSAVLELADEIAHFLVQEKPAQARHLNHLLSRAGGLVGMEPESFRPLLEQICEDWITYGELLAIPTAQAPDLEALELEAEEQSTALRLASELEVQNLRNENQQLSHLANRDRLTGLLNRGAFDDALAAAITTAAPPRAPLTLLMIDLDHFKSINDHHGHPTGDQVLRHVARLFHTWAKAPAEVFRYGGEEFTVLLPATTAAAARELAENIRLDVAGSPFLAGGKSIALTVSIGVASVRWPDGPTTPAALIQAADQQLYVAKQSGRNTCR